MGRKTYPSGLMPADTVPMTPGKASKSPDNLRDRLDNMGIPKTSALERLQVASYLSQFADADVLAEYLGVLPELQAWEGYHDKEEASAV